MSTLISKASLLLVPSVYEDGTLYNVLPSGNKAPDETGNHNGYDQTRADFTFSRGFNLAATRVNADGLIEKGRENLLTYSNDFSNAAWTKADTSVTSGQADKDGGTNAWLLSITAASGFQTLRQTKSVSGVNTISIYAKANTLNWMRITNGVSSTYFDIANGVVGTDSSIGASIESAGNGFFRCSIPFSGAGSYVYIYPATGDGNVTQSSGSIYIQNAQLEKGLVATDYIETGSSTAQAGILEDMPRINYDANGENGALLLEPSRTNLVTYSEYFGSYTQYGSPTITHNNIISPEGLKNGVKVQRGSNATPIRIPNITTLGTEYTMSIWAKAGNANQINIDIGDEFNATFELTDEWKRVDYTSTPATYTHIDISIPNSSSGDYIYIYGLQLEAASHVSSYVPTYGSAATRGADFGIANDVDTNQSEGTLFVDFDIDANAGGTYDCIIGLGDGSSGNRFGILRNDDNTIRVYMVTGGTSQVEFDTTQSSGRLKIGFAYKANDAAIYVNGTQELTDSSFSVPPNTKVAFNQYLHVLNSNTYTTQASIRQAVLFNERLTNEELATLTTL